jgi:hypothetical protein
MPLATALGGSAAPATDPEPFVPEQVDADSVLMRAEPGADGGANWTVEYRVQLDDAEIARSIAGPEVGDRAGPDCEDLPEAAAPPRCADDG